MISISFILEINKLFKHKIVNIFLFINLTCVSGNNLS